MPGLELQSRDSVFRAIQECDNLGRNSFLEKYRYGKAREYQVLLNGKHYDSKAVCGVAYSYELHEHGPLMPDEFSGGEQTVQPVWERLGFTVVRSPRTGQVETALVLVENEVTYNSAYDFWKDDTGVQYQYPNIYHLIQTGRPFVYYRGVRRRGGRRGQAEYFGTGTIGDIGQGSESES